MTTCGFRKTINRGALLGEISPRPCSKNGLHRLFTPALLTFLLFIFGSPAAWAQPTLHNTGNLLRGEEGRRPVYGGMHKLQTDPHWRDLILFHEYFHGDNGAGVGANHQTGWTGLVAKLIQQSGE